MKASPLEYRYRFLLHGVLYALAFWSPWIWIHTAHSTPLRFHSTFFTDSSLWSFGMAECSRLGLLTMDGAAVMLLLASIVLLSLGAMLRVWGAAYLSSAVVHSGGMHGEQVIAEGPYRHVRNPLYLGTFLHTLGLALIMPLSGAVFGVLAIGVLQLRLILAEEPFLEAKLGAPYLSYCRQVPRLLYSLPARVTGSYAAPQWRQAMLGEIYFIAVALGFAIFGWSYNGLLLSKVVLISLGLSLVVRAFLPRRAVATQA